MHKYIYLSLIVAIISMGCKTQKAGGQSKVKFGNEVLLEDHLPELEGKRVGVLMNHTSRIGGTHMVDTLMSLGLDVRAIFAAEHGFRGQAGAGEYIEDGIDTETGLPVYSLYGSTRKPRGNAGRCRRDPIRPARYGRAILYLLFHNGTDDGNRRRTR